MSKGREKGGGGWALKKNKPKKSPKNSCVFASKGLHHICHFLLYPKVLFKDRGHFRFWGPSTPIKLDKLHKICFVQPPLAICYPLGEW